MPDPNEYEMRAVADARVGIQDTQRVAIGSSVPATMEPTIPYATGPTVSDFAADFRFMGPFGPNMLEPAEEWEDD